MRKLAIIFAIAALGIVAGCGSEGEVGDLCDVEDDCEIAIPRPPEIGSELFDGTQRLGDTADDGELVNGAHRSVTLPTQRLLPPLVSLHSSRRHRTAA